ncbi:MAG: hypothetical protein Q7U29_12970 [Bradyrhizobium sp.]|nr:hypothetical protein [Bradyrhizobium sp.]
MLPGERANPNSNRIPDGTFLPNLLRERMSRVDSACAIADDAAKPNEHINIAAVAFGMSRLQKIFYLIS